MTFGVMARAPIPGRCKTRLARRVGDAGAARLYEAMLLDTLASLERVGAERLVVLAAPEDDGGEVLRGITSPAWEVVLQRGAGLGERLTSAFMDLRPDPENLVCVVSSDSPTMPTRSLGVLRRRRPRPTVLLGPCDDGGYYLIGMTALELGVLAGIPWSTPDVLARTRQRCAELGLDVEELATGYDVDEVEDLTRLGSELAARPDAAPRTAAAIAALDPRAWRSPS